MTFFDLVEKSINGINGLISSTNERVEENRKAVSAVVDSAVHSFLNDKVQEEAVETESETSEAVQAIELPITRPVMQAETGNVAVTDMAAGFQPSMEIPGFIQEFPTVQAVPPVTAYQQQYMQQQNFQQFVMQPQSQIVPQQGGFIHKVDTPPKQKPIRAEEDKAVLAIPQLADPIELSAKKRIPPEYVQKLEQPEIVPEAPFTNYYNNSDMISKYPNLQLQKLEEIANQHRIRVIFKEYPLYPNCVVVSSYNDGATEPSVERSFVIDNGNIIDQRVKVWFVKPGKILELSEVYEYFVFLGNKKILDEKTLNEIFEAGASNISKKQMYPESYKTLNTKIALITIPTKGITKDQRKSLQAFLMKASPILDEALKESEYSRFRFTTKDDAGHKGIDFRNMSFMLTNDGVPTCYGNVVPLHRLVTISFSNGKAEVQTHDTNIGELQIWQQ